MRFCSKCGSQVHEQAVICVNCGCSLESSNPNPSAGAAPMGQRPVRPLDTNRAWWKLLLLGIVTCGIYPLIFYSNVGSDVNEVCGRYDGKKQMHYCLVTLVLGGLTCGILPLIWWHQLSDRIGNELKRRGISYDFGAGTFWLWNVLGSMICGIGPIIYMVKLCKALNYMCEDYNNRG